MRYFQNNTTLSVITVSSNITLASGKQYLVDTSSARSLQLPAPFSGLYFYLKDKIGTCSTNNITLVRNGSEKIDGLTASRVFETDWGGWLVSSDGTDWFIS